MLRKSLWSCIKEFSAANSKPWLLLGDLNDCRVVDEKKDGTYYFSKAS